jgi:hypothetical protein
MTRQPSPTRPLTVRQRDWLVTHVERLSLKSRDIVRSAIKGLGQVERDLAQRDAARTAKAGGQ